MDGTACVGMFVALDMLASRKQGRKVLARKRRLARARRRRNFVERQAWERLFFALVLSLVAFNCCSPTKSLWRKERSSYWWDHVVNNTFSAHDWLENFRMSQATFLYVCSEIRPLIEKEDTMIDENCYSSWAASCSNSLVFGDKFRLPYNRPFVWCIKAYCLCCYQRSMCCHSEDPTTKVHSDSHWRLP